MHCCWCEHGWQRHGDPTPEQHTGPSQLQLQPLFQHSCSHSHMPLQQLQQHSHPAPTTTAHTRCYLGVYGVRLHAAMVAHCPLDNRKASFRHPLWLHICHLNWQLWHPHKHSTAPQPRYKFVYTKKGRFFFEFFFEFFLKEKKAVTAAAAHSI